MVRDVRPVPLDPDDPPGGVVDVRIRGGVVAEVGPGLAAAGEPTWAAAGRWVVPGLWDAHVHAEQWVRSTTWLPMAGTASAADACARVAQAVTRRVDQQSHLAHADPVPALIGFGHRLAIWPSRPQVADLDAASGRTPVVLIAGDVHSGWLNSAALSALGLGHRRGVLAEQEWFDVFPRIGELPGADPTASDWRNAARRLAARGVTGIVDFELGAAWRAWPARTAVGWDAVRVRAAVYPDALDDVIAAGWRTGDRLDDSGLVTMGPLKVISDGSMGTRTAWCCDPYAPSPLDAVPGEGWAGAANVGEDELARLLGRAHAAGLGAAVHAIGDRANRAALDAFAATGAQGSVEHAQLLCTDDIDRFAALGVTASVQPLHLPDDRDAAEAVWPGRTGRMYPFRSLLDAGARLAFGSDAPVARPDPWAAMAAAVRRSDDARGPWHPEQCVSWREALAASVDGVRLTPGAPGDLAVLDSAPGPTVGVVATVCAGRLTHTTEGPTA
nr:amidohydrolase family protein [Propioniciclava soli]